MPSREQRTFDPVPLAGRAAASRRAVLRVAGAGGAALAVSACARIPLTGPLGREALPGDVRPDVPYVQPRPPAEGAGPEETVLGFALAGVGPADDYGVARQYLTPEARLSWDPGAGVTLYSADAEIEATPLDESTVRLRLQSIGSVDAHGVRVRQSTPAAQELEVGVEQTAQGWRVSEPPPGIFLSDSAFALLFSAARVYFLDPRRLHLVPDLRWFSAHRAAAVALAALGAGPAPLLAPAVVSEVPAGIAADPLAADVLTRADGGLELELPDAVAALPGPAQSLAIAQIQATLRSMPALSELRVVRGGEPLQVDGATGPGRALPGHRPIAAGPTGVISLVGASGAGEPLQLVPDLQSERVLAPVISQSSPLAAALREDGGAVIIASTDGSIPRRDAAVGPALIAPRIDDAGYVWTSSPASAGAMVALSQRSSDADARIDAAWLSDRTILALDVSPDATRVLVLSRDPNGARLDLCAAVRDETGVPRALTEPVPISTGLRDLRLGGWFDETAVIVLGTDAVSGGSRALVVDLQGEGERLPAPPAGTDWIAGTAVSDAVWSSTQDERLYRVEGADWAEVDLPARQPSFY